MPIQLPFLLAYLLVADIAQLQGAVAITACYNGGERSLIDDE